MVNPPLDIKTFASCPASRGQITVPTPGTLEKPNWSFEPENLLLGFFPAEPFGLGLYTIWYLSCFVQVFDYGSPPLGDASRTAHMGRVGKFVEESQVKLVDRFCHLRLVDETVADHESNMHLGPAYTDMAETVNFAGLWKDKTRLENH